METKQTDILNLDDVKLLVNDFYEKVRDNELLSPVFNGVIKDKWPAHLERMYGFWQTLLLEVPAYSGTPFLKHAKLPIEKEHFDTWISLFNETVDEHFTGEKASEAKWRAARMSEMFQYKLDYYKNNPAQPLI
ncbi:group III truncated hemoglobin [Pedobacter frigiditerrae]|uniref:Group III truncated hemoglobin n=1 Tax=Pedobacter frigiditerrae TaxID=2530452 RepID=A0A4R0N1C3_9SPHI|nr:group III truncated hemoglobin [Pedobacter frigiditerrae]TCC93569.1 group III truncated hemoglobin [Pedobacter frigiditerrae]